MPKVSVLLPVYNAESYVAEAVESVLNQSFSDFELIILDDGSTDSSSTIVAGLSDPRIKYVRSTNVGLTKVLNKGLKMADGEYIARMDADDISDPARFGRQVDFLNRNPQVAAVGCWWKVISSSGSVVAEKTAPTGAVRIKAQFLNSAPILHSAAMFRRASVLEVDGYDETFTYAQDRDLFLRLLAHWDLAVIPEFLFFYRINPNSITLSREIEQKAYSLKAVERAIRDGLYPKRHLIWVVIKRALLSLPGPLVKLKKSVMRMLGHRHD